MASWVGDKVMFPQAQGGQTKTFSFPFLFCVIIRDINLVISTGGCMLSVADNGRLEREDRLLQAECWYRFQNVLL